MEWKKKSMTVKSNIKNTDDFLIEELINQISCAPDEFKNLQIFLRWDGKTNHYSEAEFLMVTPTCFGRVKILNLNVDNDYIIIEFFDCQTQAVGNVRVKIHEERPSVLFVSWKDILSMVNSDRNTISDNSGLLEFDY